MNFANAKGPARILATFLVITLPGMAAHADDTATLDVTASVPKTCKIDSTTDVAFGDVNTDGTDTDTSTGGVEWRCSKNSATVIELDGGGSGDINAREMVHDTLPAEKLSYQLYTDSPGGTVWGDGTDGSTLGITGTGMGAGNAATSTVYGRVVGTTAENAAEGDYSDSVTVTVIF